MMASTSDPVSAEMDNKSYLNDISEEDLKLINHLTWLYGGYKMRDRTTKVSYKQDNILNNNGSIQRVPRLKAEIIRTRGRPPKAQAAAGRSDSATPRSNSSAAQAGNHTSRPNNASNKSRSKNSPKSLKYHVEQANMAYQGRFAASTDSGHNTRFKSRSRASIASSNDSFDQMLAEYFEESSSFDIDLGLNRPSNSKSGQRSRRPKVKSPKRSDALPESNKPGDAASDELGADSSFQALPNDQATASSSTRTNSITSTSSSQSSRLGGRSLGLDGPTTKLELARQLMNRRLRYDIGASVHEHRKPTWPESYSLSDKIEEFISKKIADATEFRPKEPTTLSICSQFALQNHEAMVADSDRVHYYRAAIFWTGFPEESDDTSFRRSDSTVSADSDGPTPCSGNHAEHSSMLSHEQSAVNDKFSERLKTLEGIHGKLSEELKGADEHVSLTCMGSPVPSLDSTTDSTSSIPSIPNLVSLDGLDAVGGLPYSTIGSNMSRLDSNLTTQYAYSSTDGADDTPSLQEFNLLENTPVNGSGSVDSLGSTTVSNGSPLCDFEIVRPTSPYSNPLSSNAPCVYGSTPMGGEKYYCTGKRILEIGTGPMCVLAMNALKAGAKYIDALEVSDHASRLAGKLMAAYGFDNIIRVFNSHSKLFVFDQNGYFSGSATPRPDIHKRVAPALDDLSTAGTPCEKSALNSNSASSKLELTLPLYPPYDMVISEILGDFASQEGVADVFLDFQRRILFENKRFIDTVKSIPCRVSTMFVPCFFPDASNILNKSCTDREMTIFSPSKKMLQSVGMRIDNLPICEDWLPLEQLDLESWMLPQMCQHHLNLFRVSSFGDLAGLLVGIDVEIRPGEHFGTRYGQCESWYTNLVLFEREYTVFEGDLVLVSSVANLTNYSRVNCDGSKVQVSRPSYGFVVWILAPIDSVNGSPLSGFNFSDVLSDPMVDSDHYAPSSNDSDPIDGDVFDLDSFFISLSNSFSVNTVSQPDGFVPLSTPNALKNSSSLSPCVSVTSNHTHTHPCSGGSQNAFVGPETYTSSDLSDFAVDSTPAPSVISTVRFRCPELCTYDVSEKTSISFDSLNKLHDALNTGCRYSEDILAGYDHVSVGGQLFKVMHRPDVIYIDYDEQTSTIYYDTPCAKRKMHTDPPKRYSKIKVKSTKII